MHPHELRCADESPDGESRERCEPTFGVGDQFRLDEPHVKSAGPEGARSGREDVLHPIDISCVGQEEDGRRCTWTASVRDVSDFEQNWLPCSVSAQWAIRID